MTLVTRFAPSPTGYLHIGSLRTVLFNYLYAKQKGGKFLLRVEDTDQARFVEGSIENMLTVLGKFGLTPDEGPNKDGGHGPYIQSQRLAIYQKYIQELITKDHAYYCFCSSERLDELRTQQQELGMATKYDGHCRYLSEAEQKELLEQGIPYTIRLKVSKNITIEFKDFIKGKISVPSKDVDDQVLMKSDGFPTYHFAVVVDDHLMEVTDIIRGDEWIPSTPKHILIYNAFGWEIPHISHVPPLVGADRKKLSKRTGDVAVEQYLQKGYLVPAIINYLALLGWNPKTTQEFFSFEELIEKFDLEAVHKAGAFFDVERLDFFNSHYIKELSNNELLKVYTTWLQEYDMDFLTVIESFPKSYNEQILGELKNRIKKLEDIKLLTSFFYNNPQTPAITDIVNEKMGLSNSEEILKALSLSREILKNLSSEDLSLDDIKSHYIEKIKEAGFKNGQILWPTRYVLSGEAFSPGAFEMIGILGKEESLKRLESFFQKRG